MHIVYTMYTLHFFILATYANNITNMKKYKETKSII
jgi:hypothetical protein